MERREKLVDPLKNGNATKHSDRPPEIADDKRYKEHFPVTLIHLAVVMRLFAHVDRTDERIGHNGEHEKDREAPLPVGPGEHTHKAI